jgi:RNA polymerase sigma factor (sigma-70 family)
MTPTDLLLRTHRGDPDAARALWERYAGRLLAYAAVVLGRAASGPTGPSSDAEIEPIDAVQGALLRVLRTDRRVLLGVHDPGAWLATAVRREILDARRAARSRRDRERRTDAPPVAHHAHDGRAGSHTQVEVLADLETAVHALDEPLREIIALRHFAGLTFDQCAAVLNEPRSTLASRYRAALEQLRGRLEVPEPVPATAHAAAAPAAPPLPSHPGAPS